MVLVSWDSSGIWASHSVLGCFLNPSQQTAVRKLMCTATVCCLKRYVILLMTTIAVSIPRNIRVQAVLCRYTVMCITHMSLISRCAVCNIASALQVRHSGAGHPSASGSAAPLTALHLHSMPHLPDHQLPHDSVLSLAQSSAVTITRPGQLTTQSGGGIWVAPQQGGPLGVPISARALLPLSQEPTQARPLAQPLALADLRSGGGILVGHGSPLPVRLVKAKAAGPVRQRRQMPGQQTGHNLLGTALVICKDHGNAGVC